MYFLFILNQKQIGCYYNRKTNYSDIVFLFGITICDVAF